MSDNSINANWTYPTNLWVGAGRIKELAQACRSSGFCKPLFVTDAGIVNLPITELALTHLKKDGIECNVFSDVKPNPTGTNVEAGIKIFQEGGHDGVIAFGGGSALDAAKAIALMGKQSRPLWDFEDIGENWKRVEEKGIAPIVAVPTTAGTGSEVGRSSLIIHEEQCRKVIIFHPKMLPSIVILDPQLTVGLPPSITAATGMDAFSHCLEAYCSPSYHPMCEGIAVEGMRLIKEALPRAVKDGTNIDARTDMIVAASMGSVAFQKGLGGMHSLSHPAGAVYDAPHGLTNAIVMPYVLMNNRVAIEDKIERLAAFLGITDCSFDGFIDFILELREEVGIPHTIDKIGITDNSKFNLMAEMAEVDPTASGNPIKLTKKMCLDMFEAALAGNLR